ncbi:MAG: transcription-repair coupling factor [Clostridiales bacterium]|nr:transcription-repair coupling factor [Clostridiales bacterium]
MLDLITNLTTRKNSLSEFLSSIRQGMPLAVFGVADPFKSLLVSAIDTPVLLVVKDSLTADFFSTQIKELSEKKVVFIPPKDELISINKAFSKDSIYQRITGTYGIRTADVIIVTADSLLQKFNKNVKSLTLKKDNDYDITTLSKWLAQNGYERVDMVSSKGTFSVRGDIFEVFPINFENPVRLDFFGDTIESIKVYDADSRETVEFISEVLLLQAVDLAFTDQDLTKIKNLVKAELSNADKDQIVRKSVICEDVLRAIEVKDYDVLGTFSSISCDSVCITEILPDNTVIVFDESKRLKESMDFYQTEFTERFKSLYQSGNAFKIAENNLIPSEIVCESLNNFKTVALQTLSTAIPFFNPLKIINPSSSSVINYRLDFKEVYTDIDNWLKGGYTVIVNTGNATRAENFCYELSKQNIASSITNAFNPKGVSVTTKKLNAGLIFHEEKLVLIGSGNLYAKPTTAKRFRSKKQTYFSAPETGDYCVHETHGIGKVIGNKKITTTEGTKDYVAVEYSGGDLLYIPVEQMDILTRYLGSEKKPKLSRLGGKDFERIKRNVKDSIKKMSFDLKKLYEERSSLVGFKFETDNDMQTVFDGAFEFEETPDQTQAIEEIYSDMTSGKVMDRLVCGDVGYGKTEVAFRAVFLAVLNGKQVALLAPTTILCEQHYNTAVKRFKDFGIKIACLDRFKTPKEQKGILSELKEGKIDFLIGTHRLLSKDVEFKDLGLLVLDEEQRFGVEHKEKIKLLKTNVDTLTLTATPIPRTLHMSLSGIRSISVINTPPKKRLPVQTYVTEETETLIKDAISREINRGGQAFILYNRVESIFSFSEKVKTLMPNLRLIVVHGQMEERVMERNVNAFYKGEADVLISTTIIENGIDLPRANTLIVIDADKLGLSTLYQLKGRVGRSDRLAYAYFTFKREKVLSDTAYHRLNAIVEFAEMGSGIKIAMRDLEIRGAGNVLGAQQHGHMEKIGYELYSKLLRAELDGEEDFTVELDIRVNAFIPDGYIESNSARMSAYKEIAEITSLDREKEVRETLIENFGTFPQEVDNLIEIATVKMLAKSIKATLINVNKSACSICFDSFNAFKNGSIMDAVDKMQGEVFVSAVTKPAIEFNRVGDNVEMLKKVKEFLILTLKD